MTKISNQYSLTNILTADLTNSRLGINNVSPTVALDVTGAGKFSGVLTLGSTISNGTYAYTLPSATGTLALTSAISGTTNYVAKFTSSTAIGIGLIQDNGTDIGINGSPTSIGGYTSLTINNTSSGSFIDLNNSGVNNLRFLSLSSIDQRIQASGNLRFDTAGVARLTLASTGAATFSSSVTAGGNISITSSTGNRIGFNTPDSFSALGTTIPQYGLGYGWSTQPLGLSGYYGLAFFSEGSERMRITSAGNVGIGTSSPDQLVSIRKTSAGSETIALALQNVAGTAGTAVSMVFCPHENSSTPEPLAKISGIRMAASGALTDLAFYTFITPGGLIERMRIKSEGELCVGTNTPSYNTTNRGNITINGSASSLLAFQVGGTAKAYIYSDGTNWSLNNNASGTLYMLSTSGGVQLNSGATSWASSSDERLKNINSNIENAVDKLSSLRTVNFSWKSDETQKEVLGLIAQDVDKVFPQVVDKGKLPFDINGERTDETEYLNVRYTELVPVLVKAIQELSAKVSLLENK